MKHAVAYMRCSGKASLTGDTWERQAENISRCAESQGYELLVFWWERAVPGKTEGQDRPAFQDMVADLLGNGCRTIIVESLDRLAREYRIQEQLVIYMASKNLTLIAANTGENITEAMMGDPMRRALVQMQGVLAELEKNMLIARTRKARERIRGRGEQCEGRKAYGARPEEQETLRLILDNASQGQSPSAIANMLDALKITTRYGKRWNSGSIWKIIERNQKPS